jgi:hypothetical protein
LGFQEVEAPEFLDNWHMKVVRLSALRNGRLYPAGRIPGTNTNMYSEESGWEVVDWISVAQIGDSKPTGSIK